MSEDTAYIESFRATLCIEYLWSREFESFQHAQQVIHAAFLDYNQERVHSSLGYKTPNEKHAEAIQALKKVPMKLC